MASNNEIFRTKAPIKLEKFQALLNLYRDDLEPDAELRYYNGAFIVERVDAKQ